MTRKENEEHVKNFFEQLKPFYTKLASDLVDDAQAAIDEAAEIFAEMIPDMAYVDKREHVMAPAVFGCNALLAVYLALKSRGVGLHDYGRAILTKMARTPLPEDEPEEDNSLRERFAAFVATAEASQRDAEPGEFVFEAFLGDQTDFDWGINIKSCAICHAFSKYDAMALVPYMCATDDVMSDRGHQGLQRTGTIAVGAHQCDFRYKRGRESQHLAELYPGRIRVQDKG